MTETVSETAAAPASVTVTLDAESAGLVLDALGILARARGSVTRDHAVCSRICAAIRDALKGTEPRAETEAGA